MNIAGLQKVSTIDYPGEVCCVIFLYGCNFRCGFCYNVDLVLGEPKKNFSEEEILEFLKARKGKLDAVCISGGEPLISLDLGFARKIKDLGYKIKIDTNGSFPGKLKEMIDEKLVDYIAMDVKGERGNYSEISGVDVNILKIEESIRLVDNFENSEFRTTIVKRYHDLDEIKSMAKWMNDVCGKKPNQIFFQGFKRMEKGMVDKDFLNEKDISEKYLEEIKKVAEDFFVKVGVRV